MRKKRFLVSKVQHSDNLYLKKENYCEMQFKKKDDHNDMLNNIQSSKFREGTLIWR